MKDFKELSIREREDLLSMGGRAFSVKDPIAYWNKAVKKNPANKFAREYMTILYGDVRRDCTANEYRQADEIISARYGVQTIEQMRDKSFLAFKAHIAQLREENP